MIKKAFRYSACFILYYSGLLFIFNLFYNKKGRARVLLYHKVDNDVDSFFPPVTTRHFREQIDYLKRHYKIVSLRDIADSVINRTGIDKKSVAITFDDGYAGIYDNVLPIVKEYGIPITVFVVSGCISDSRAMWTDILHFFVENTVEKSLRLEEFSNILFSLRSRDEKRKACLLIKDRMKLMSNDKKNELLTAIGCTLNVAYPHTQWLMMTPGQLIELKNAGCEIGSHSVTHPNLTKLNREVARNELAASRERIEQLIGCTVDSFSYPFGAFNDTITTLLKETGYTYACKVSGVPVSDVSTAYEIDRIYITDCPICVYAVEISGLLGLVRRLVRGC